MGTGSVTTTAPVVFQGPVTQQQFIDVVNNNTRQVRQLESQVRVATSGLPGISGSLALERPNRLRLKADLFGTNNGVDLGSNDDHFWVWIKSSLPGQKPVLLYSRHADFEQSQMRQMIPIEPKWVTQAIGLVELDPNGIHEGPFLRPDQQFELRSTIQSTHGQSTRITVVDPLYGWVTEQQVFDASGKMLAAVKASKHQHYPHIGVSLPRRVEIQVAPNTDQAMNLKMDIGTYIINQLYADPATLWSMPSPAGVPMIDISRPPPGFPGVQPVAAGNYSPVPDLSTAQRTFNPNYRGAVSR